MEDNPYENGQSVAPPVELDLDKMTPDEALGLEGEELKAFYELLNFGYAARVREAEPGSKMYHADMALAAFYLKLSQESVSFGILEREAFYPAPEQLLRIAKQGQQYRDSLTQSTRPA
ncbi:hypothetical protein KJ965_00470 [Patescibacteria group bacterium]|nr:hypothetical protein [Patescibacteria group bacterium]